ncbi:unnamed protein product [Durusdinium trenchii]|uniref:Uncharacterized protein n=1 Tax=Durusdinium trenchii TaxID=1381693 RepID=A0ABP0NC37_9DINO
MDARSSEDAQDFSPSPRNLAAYARLQDGVLSERSPAFSATATPCSSVPWGATPCSAHATPCSARLADHSLPSSPRGTRTRGIHLAPYHGPASVEVPAAHSVVKEAAPPSITQRKVEQHTSPAHIIQHRGETLVEEHLKQEFVDVPVITEEVRFLDIPDIREVEKIEEVPQVVPVPYEHLVEEIVKVPRVTKEERLVQRPALRSAELQTPSDSGPEATLFQGIQANRY